MITTSLLSRRLRAPSKQLIAYTLPVVGVNFLMSAIVILHGIYAKYFGVALTTIATVLLISRLFDAITDPVIGYCSDRYYTRTGSRKPFILWGGVLLIVSGYFLFIPVDATTLNTLDPNALTSPLVSDTYFLIWFLALYLAFTLFEVPHMAWGGELDTNAQEKNTLFGLRAMGTFLGSLLFLAIPLLPLFEGTAFTPHTLQWAVLLAGCLILPTLYFCVTSVPNGKHTQTACHTQPTPLPQKESLGVVLSSIVGNRPLLWFFSAFLFTGMGIGMWLSLTFLFVESYLALGDNFSLIYVTAFGISTLTIMIWPTLASRWSKKGAWASGMVITTVGLLGWQFLTPGEATAPLVLCMTLIYTGFAALNTVAPSILADIIDYSTWKFGRHRGGTYFSLYTFMLKTNTAIGGALGLAIASAYGFDATATTHSAETVLGLHLAMVWLPVLMLLGSIACIALIPINAHHHKIIRRCLDTRWNRVKAVPQSDKQHSPHPRVQPQEACTL